MLVCPGSGRVISAAKRDDKLRSKTRLSPKPLQPHLNHLRSHALVNLILRQNLFNNHASTCIFQPWYRCSSVIVAVASMCPKQSSHKSNKRRSAVAVITQLYRTDACPCAAPEACLGFLLFLLCGGVLHAHGSPAIGQTFS